MHICSNRKVLALLLLFCDPIFDLVVNLKTVKSRNGKSLTKKFNIEEQMSFYPCTSLVFNNIIFLPRCQLTWMMMQFSSRYISSTFCLHSNYSDYFISIMYFESIVPFPPRQPCIVI